MITPLGSVFDAANQQRQSYDCIATRLKLYKSTTDVYMSIVMY
jgi:hypothetical protein